MATGEWSNMMVVDQQTAEICSQIKGELEKQSNQTFSDFFPYAYRVNQRIGGATYYVKVYVGSGKGVLLKILTMLTQDGVTPNLDSFQHLDRLYEEIPI